MTVSPNTEKRGLELPMTPAHTGPELMPTRSSVDCREEKVLIYLPFHIRWALARRTELENPATNRETLPSQTVAETRGLSLW